MNNNIHSVTKVLKLLEVMNLQSITSIERLHELTKMPKPTIVRMLNTLAAEGYVQKVSRSAGYGLTERILRISVGYRYTDYVVEVAREILLDYTARYKWPVLIATFDRDAMVLRFSTKWQSPFADHEGDLTSMRMPMLISAGGLAYLAFCPNEERESILSLLRASPLSSNKMARDEQATARMLADVKSKGYSIKPSMKIDPFVGMGLPIRRGNNVAAALSFRYLPSAMSEAKAAETYLAPLREAAASIEAVLNEKSEQKTSIPA